MSINKTILIVEDEDHIAQGIQLNLEMEGYKTIVAPDGPSALEIADSTHLDLILLDIMLPGISGYDVCKEIRGKGSRVPILFLTAKSDEEDRIQGLEVGGDDYITKPFSLKELLLRIKAIFRRQAWFATPGKVEDEYRFGGNVINFKTFTGKGPHGTVTLTRKECMMLKFFAEHPNEVVSRDMLLDGVWGYDAYPTTRTIDNFVLRLRKHFEDDPAHPEMFLTVFGAGYKFVPPST
ncbi:MAG: response regulator [candidate division Zixibacteria bacterium]|nr:response regulator [candidate division Zixibacteria bacterium]